jgi:hypothetical protein
MVGLERFQLDARAALAWNHANVCPLFAVAGFEGPFSGRWNAWQERLCGGGSAVRR